MKMYQPKSVIAAALLGLTMISTSAAAQRYDFAFDDRTTANNDFSFSLPDGTAPSFADELGFGIEDVSIQRFVAGVQQVSVSDVSFFFDIEGGGFATDFDDLRGTQLFTGLGTSPTFRLGRFELNRFGDGGDLVAVGDLTISTEAAAVPEPATWVMMIVGFGVAGVMLRRKAGPSLHRADVI